MEGLLERVAELKASSEYAGDDRKAIRQEVVAVEKRIADRLTEIRRQIAEVDEECKDFRRTAAAEWQSVREELSAMRADLQGVASTIKASEGRQQRKASTTVAWIGGAFVLVTGLVQTGATLLGG